MKHGLYPTLMMLLLFSCHRGSPQHNISNEFEKGKRLGELTSKKIPEASGLAASAYNPGMIWTINDSGNDAEVFLLDQKADVKQVFKLAGVDNRDWEEIFVGPGPDNGKSYLYVGEIGDNLAMHPSKYIYRFEEPIYQEAANQAIITDFDTITFVLEDSKRDTEALLFDRSTKDIYVVSKWSEPVYVYKLTFPYSTNDTITVPQVATVPLHTIVAGDISKDGKEIILKNYDHLYYWKNESGMSIPEILQTTPMEIPYEREPQGESVTWALDNSGFYTLSEMSKGKKSFLYFYKRK